MLDEERFLEGLQDPEARDHQEHEGEHQERERPLLASDRADRPEESGRRGSACSEDRELAIVDPREKSGDAVCDGVDLGRREAHLHTTIGDTHAPFRIERQDPG